LIFLLTYIVALLLVITYQDFKERAISWWLLPLLMLGFVIVSLKQNHWYQYLINCLINNAFCGFMFTIITTYFSVKHKSFVNIINNMLGIGDILFFVVLSFCFSHVHYIFFMISSLFIASLFGFYFQYKKQTIPLAGIQAMVFILYYFVCQHFSISLQNDYFLLTFVEPKM